MSSMEISMARVDYDPFDEFNRLIDAAQAYRPEDQNVMVESLDQHIRALFEDVSSDTSRELQEVTSRLQQMAMILGVMACSHNHYQTLADELGALYGAREEHHDHAYAHDELSESYEHSRKRKPRKTFIELIRELFNGKALSRKWFFSL